jgi:exonuclease VII small subunit
MMLTCRELTELVTEYLEGKLSLGQRLRFEMHIALCRHCRAYLRQMEQTVQILGKLPEESVPPDALNELLERFRGWKR